MMRFTIPAELRCSPPRAFAIGLQYCVNILSEASATNLDPRWLTRKRVKRDWQHHPCTFRPQIHVTPRRSKISLHLNAQAHSHRQYCLARHAFLTQRGKIRSQRYVSDALLKFDRC